LISKIDNKNLKIEIAKSRKTEQEIARYVPSIKKAKKDLGLKVYTPLEASIQKMIKYYSI